MSRRRHLSLEFVDVVAGAGAEVGLEPTGLAGREAPAAAAGDAGVAVGAEAAAGGVGRRRRPLDAGRTRLAGAVGRPPAHRHHRVAHAASRLVDALARVPRPVLHPVFFAKKEKNWFGFFKLKKQLLDHLGMVIN